jgi:hypothetical protein
MREPLNNFQMLAKKAIVDQPFVAAAVAWPEGRL